MRYYEIVSYLHESFDNIKEANIIGSGIHIKEIPDDIRNNHKLIGKGTTSLVFEKDDSTVLLFTRDKIKEEWFRTSGIGKQVGEYESKGHPNHNIREMPIYIFEVEKLFPLDPENKKKVKQMIKILNDERIKHFNKDRSYFFNAVLNDLDLDFTSHKSLEEFLNFIKNYGEDQYSFDFLLRNFMQNKEGEIIANDLVVDKELLDAIMKQKMNRYR